MAKVTAPLFSFSARGAIADALVYFPWKGIAAVRQYVIPANPKTAAQQTQRGYVDDANLLWHTEYWNTSDLAAWKTLAQYIGDVMSGFNAFMRRYLIVRGKPAAWKRLYGNITAGGAVGHIIYKVDGIDEATVVQVYYGLTPTALYANAALAFVAGFWILDVAGLVSGSKYYFRFTQPSEAVGPTGYTGIYSIVCP